MVTATNNLEYYDGRIHAVTRISGRKVPTNRCTSPTNIMNVSVNMYQLMYQLILMYQLYTRISFSDYNY